MIVLSGRRPSAEAWYRHRHRPGPGTDCTVNYCAELYTGSQDVADEVPTFPTAQYEATVPENMADHPVTTVLYMKICY